MVIRCMLEFAVRARWVPFVLSFSWLLVLCFRIRLTLSLSLSLSLSLFLFLSLHWPKGSLFSPALTS